MNIISKLDDLRRALAESQRNHHSQMVFLKNSGNRFGAGHYGSGWRKCPAISCQQAARAEEASKR